MNEELVYLFIYTLGNGTVGEVKIKANNFDNAYEKFDEWKVEKGLNSDLDSSIVELKYRYGKDNEQLIDTIETLLESNNYNWEEENDILKINGMYFVMQW